MTKADPPRTDTLRPPIVAISGVQSRPSAPVPLAAVAGTPRISGGQGRDRTIDLPLFRRSLYQLSYLAVRRDRMRSTREPRGVYRTPYAGLLTGRAVCHGPAVGDGRATGSGIQAYGGSKPESRLCRANAAVQGLRLSLSAPRSMSRTRSIISPFPLSSKHNHVGGADLVQLIES